MPERSADRVEVTVVQSGGFAGLTRRYAVSAATLGAAERAALDALVAAVLRQGADRAAAAAQPDRFQFDVEIVTGDGRASFRAPEQQCPAALRALIDWVKAAKR